MNEVVTTVTIITPKSRSNDLKSRFHGVLTR